MEYKEFATKEEAKEHIETQGVIFLGFCPVIRDDCRTDCICFFPAAPLKFSRYDAETRKQVPYFTVSQPYCDHVLICGTVTIQQ
jgi:hypothetical protein